MYFLAIDEMKSLKLIFFDQTSKCDQTFKVTAKSMSHVKEKERGSTIFKQIYFCIFRRISLHKPSNDKQGVTFSEGFENFG